LLREVRNLARQNRFDYLLIESTGISKPLPVAETFTFEDEQGECLGTLARLDTLVTVVDAVNFQADYESIDELVERGIGVDEDDRRDVVQLLVDQIEFANVLVISKCDLVSVEEIAALEKLLHHLNPTANIVRSQKGDVLLPELLNTKRFSEEWAAENRNWLVVSRGEEQSETDEYGFSSVAFRARRPFHPARLRQFVEDDELDGVVRSKGVMWLATRHDIAGEWSHAGRVYAIHPAGLWAASTEESEWPDNPDFAEEIRGVWEEPFGDRRSELVLIGRHLNQTRLFAALEECLLTDEEMAAGPAVWEAFEDPFDPWMDACDLTEDDAS
jgi:G3E family GTPase